MDLGLVGFDAPVLNKALQSIPDDVDDSKYSANAITNAEAMLASADFKEFTKAFEFLRDMPDAIKATRVRDVIDLPKPLIEMPYSMVATPADVNQLPNAYEFIIDTPGLKSGDIKVQMEEEDNIMVVTGNRRREEKKEGVKCVRLERCVGKFKRKFVLPDDAKTDAISAVCQDGVLTVTVEKLPPHSQPKKAIISEVKVA